MAGKYRAPGFTSGEILLPAVGVNPEKWAVIACDQFTSQMDYWQKAEEIAGDAPSALRVTLPEIYLSETETRTPAIRKAMADYLRGGILTSGVTDGFVLVDRTTTRGHRLGLVGMIDLDAYEYTPGAKSLVRPTEGTIPERVPPRAKIRAGAPMEIPHVMMLIDDPRETLIEELYAGKDKLRRLYDFGLMLGGGHIAGYAVEGESAARAVSALMNLCDKADGLLYAVGDGNHSLAAAKSCWESVKAGLSDAERENHPCRYAMAELVNIHCPALNFEPIHRVMKGVLGEEVIAEYEKFLSDKGITPVSGTDVIALTAKDEKRYGFSKHPLADLQEFLGAYAACHPGAELDYIHGEADLRNLVKDGGAGFLLRSINKSELFAFIRERGVLPRKAFSMGEARDKRYYLEARRL